MESRKFTKPNNSFSQSDVIMNMGNCNYSIDLDYTPISFKKNKIPKTNISEDMKKYTKSYEFKDNTISESYFDMSMSNSSDFVKEYIANYPKGIFLIVNNSVCAEKSSIISTIMQYNKKNIIFFNGDITNSTETTSEDRVIQALKTSYKNASDGQAIILLGVDEDFDLFEHIEV